MDSLPWQNVPQTPWYIVTQWLPTHHAFLCPALYNLISAISPITRVYIPDPTPPHPTPPIWESLKASFAQQSGPEATLQLPKLGL
jgi:hypothetical protein